jgi:hypothetical protein
MPDPISRRVALTGSAALIAVPLLLRSNLAFAVGFGLAPYGTNWRAHKTSTKANIVQLSNGIKADTPATLADIDTGQLALWSRERVFGDWTITFGYKVLSRLTDPGGTFACFYFNGVGEGTSRYPINIANWNNITPSDTVYFRHSRGLRFSFATHNPDKPDLPHRLRLRRYDRSNGPFVGEQSPPDFPFMTGVPYLVAVTRKGITLTIAVTNKNTSQTKSYSWTDATWIPKWRDGHVGFRWRGQDCELTDFTVRQL